MGLVITQQEMFVFLEKTLKRKNGLFLLSLASQSGKDAAQPVNIPLKGMLTGTKRLFSVEWRLMQLKGWIGISTGTFTCKTVTEMELITQFWLERSENSHTLTTTTTRSKNSQKVKCKTNTQPHNSVD